MKHSTHTTVLINRDDLAAMRQGRMLAVRTPSGDEVLVGWDGRFMPLDSPPPSTNGHRKPPNTEGSVSKKYQDNATAPAVEGEDFKTGADGRRVYTVAFRKKVVAFAKEGKRGAPAAADRFGITPGVVRQWVKGRGV